MMSLRSRRAAHDAAAEMVPSTVGPDPRGGLIAVAPALRRMADLREAVDRDTDAGLAVHRRIGRGARLLRRALPVLDALLLLWFLAGVLNADLTTVDATVAVAAALALLCTVAVAAWNGAVGEHLQRSKDRGSGDLLWVHLDATSWGMLAVTAVMDVLLGAMMWLRVEDEVAQASAASGTGAAVIALALAAAVVIVNIYVLYLAFRDGSPLTRELDALARVVRPHLRRARRERRRSASASRRLATREEAGARVTHVIHDTSSRKVRDDGGEPLMS